jgi:hypothetical protein
MNYLSVMESLVLQVRNLVVGSSDFPALRLAILTFKAVKVFPPGNLCEGHFRAAVYEYTSKKEKH